MLSFLIVGLLLSSELLYGQGIEDRIAPFQKEMLEVTSYPEFPDAGAVILSDVGTLKSLFVFTGWVGMTKVKRRIHILSESEISRGDVELFYYYKGGSESINQVKGRTYNLVEGDTIVSELNEEDIYSETLDEEYARMKFSLPNVKAGSIFEYEFIRTEANLFSPSPWFFQSDIPTLVSDYQVFLPANYDYTYVVLGSDSEKLESVSDGNWRMENLPGITEEPYSSGLMNYLSQIRLQLQGVTQNGSYKKVLEDWPSFTKKLLASDFMGKKFKQKVKIKSDEWSVLSNLSEDKEKMVEIYNHVKDKMTWDGSHSYLCFRKTNDAYKEQKGTSAEINFILLNLLRKANLQADPVLISTRDMLMPIKDFPLATAFNHVIIHVSIGGEEYFLDATDPQRPYNLLAFEDLHQIGWLLRKENPGWVNIPNDYPAMQGINVLANIDEDGFEAGLQGYSEGYYGLNIRRAIDEIGVDEYANSLSTSMVEDENGETFHLENLEEIDKPLKWKYQLEENEYVIESNDRIYINPMFGFELEENPFMSKERYHPVDFGHTFQQNYSITFLIPEDYEVESLPESQRYILPNRVGAFEYVVGEEDGRIQMRSSVKIRETLFIPEGYFYLRELYDKMITKQSEQWVLRKKS
ncbi:MAG: DUF3857 domain-containing protein [Bacteroidota bacterium]